MLQPRFWFVMVLMLVLGTIARGAIGATESELVAQFGAVQGRQPERILEDRVVHVVGERLVLKPAGWRVIAVLIEGRCAKITYVKTSAWLEQNYQTLLQENAGSWTWQDVTGKTPKWQRTWRRSDGLVAKWKYAAGFSIEGHVFVDARERHRERVPQAPPDAATP